jgi:hypothetical protein
LDPRLSHRAGWARHFREWRRNLTPELRATFDAPLEASFRGNVPPRIGESHAIAASTVLSEFYSGNLDALLRLLDGARLDQLASITQKLAADTGLHDALIPLLQERAAPSNRANPIVYSNAILALLALRLAEQAWTAVDSTNDPAAFARLHIGCRDAGVNPELLGAEVLREEWLMEHSPWFDLRPLDSGDPEITAARDRRLHIALLGLAEWTWQDLERFPREQWHTHRRALAHSPRGPPSFRRTVRPAEVGNAPFVPFSRPALALRSRPP